MNFQNNAIGVRHRRVCAWGAAEVIYITDHSDLLFDDATAQRLRYAGTLHVLCFAWLANATWGAFLFKPKPKWHYFEHMLEFAVQWKLNPRGWACWGEESFLAKVKCLGQRCHGKTMLLRSLQRYLLCLGMRWETRRRCGTLALKNHTNHLDASTIISDDCDVFLNEASQSAQFETPINLKLLCAPWRSPKLLHCQMLLSFELPCGWSLMF